MPSSERAFLWVKRNYDDMAMLLLFLNDTTGKTCTATTQWSRFIGVIVTAFTAGIPAMYQTVVFSVYTTSPVVDISVSLRVRGQYTTSASVWPLVMVSRSGNNFTN